MLEAFLETGGIRFILIFFRLVGFFLLVPVLGSTVIPVRIRVLLLLFLSVIFWPVVETAPEMEMEYLFIYCFSEFARGLLMGFISMLVFSTLQLSGQFLDLRMGFAIVNVMDPLQGRPVPLMGQFLNILAVLIFLLLEGHHQVLQIFARSFSSVPPGTTLSLTRAFPYLLRFLGDIFILAFRVALPIIIILFIVDIAFGFLARTVPQINIFIVGLPTKIFMGFLLLFLTWSIYHDFLVRLFLEHFQRMQIFLRQLG